MFNLLISANPAAWETDQLMRIPRDRFKEHTSSGEADVVTLAKPQSLKLLDHVPTFLAYELFRKGPAAGVVRFGYVRDVRVSGEDIVFRFIEEGRLTRSFLRKHADHLGINNWEFNRTHWAIKEGDVPKAVLEKLKLSYDIVFSFAGEQRDFVERTATFLSDNGVRIFYDRYEEADLWGKNLAEHFDIIYRRSGRYCVLFISAAYKRKMWTRHERRAALSRALIEREEYLLPARFDDTEIDGVLPTVAYIALREKTPENFGRLILKKLGRKIAK